jgi:hypothetical protein
LTAETATPSRGVRPFSARLSVSARRSLSAAMSAGFGLGASTATISSGDALDDVGPFRRNAPFEQGVFGGRVTTFEGVVRISRQAASARRLPQLR